MAVSNSNCPPPPKKNLRAQQLKLNRSKKPNEQNSVDLRTQQLANVSGLLLCNILCTVSSSVLLAMSLVAIVLSWTLFNFNKFLKSYKNRPKLSRFGKWGPHNQKLSRSRDPNDQNSVDLRTQTTKKG